MSKGYQIKERLVERDDSVVRVHYAYDVKENCRFSDELYRFPLLALVDVPLDRITPSDLYAYKQFVK